MTTFAEMRTLVIAQTKRPELVAQTDAAIRVATLRAHHTDFFERDLAIAPLSYSPSSSALYYDLPNISGSILRLRAFQLLRCLDASGAPAEELEYRTNDDVYDKDNNRRQHIFTRIGDTLRIYPTAATGNLEVFYYQNPDVAEATYASWIADNHPDELALWASAIVWARSGFAEMAADANKVHVQPFKEQLLSDYLVGSVS
jgi:hypothetical protein